MTYRASWNRSGVMGTRTRSLTWDPPPSSQIWATSCRFEWRRGMLQSTSDSLSVKLSAYFETHAYYFYHLMYHTNIVYT